jgi:hypothetical protein
VRMEMITRYVGPEGSASEGTVART